MPSEDERAIAVLTRAMAVCRGMLYSARTGDASQAEIELILDSTSETQLKALIGETGWRRASNLAEALPDKDKDALLGIADGD